MDGLSGVASGMAVASLSIQLIDSIGTIRAFIRDVKGASKELQRLAELLDRLRALLEDIRNVMMKQTSLQAQHFPAPSMTIFNSLKGCEEALRVLEQAVEKYKSARSGAGSAMMKLKEDVRFGFKTKDMATVEARIQREIDHLHAALGMNMTSILTTTLPTLLQNQQTYIMALHSHSSQQSHPASALEQGTSRSDTDMVSWSKSSGLRPVTRQHRLASPLERVGIYQKVSVRSLQYEKRTRNEKSASVEDVISETRDVLLRWKIFNLGLQWTRKYPYGGIGVSLTVYPVIETFTDEYVKLLETASISDVQQKISSGQLHPYVRNVNGLSLLNLAARYHRADIYRLLLQHGERPGLTTISFIWALVVAPKNRSETDQIDIFRCFLLEDEVSHGLERLDDFYFSYSKVAVATLEWLWMNAGHTLVGTDLTIFRSILLREIINQCSRSGMTVDTLTDQIVHLVDAEMRRHLMSGELRLIKSIFVGTTSMESQQIGSNFIALLGRLDLDFKDCIEMELANLPDGLLECHSLEDSRNQKVVFEYREDGDSILKWVWVFDSEEQGYLLVSELVSLGADSEGLRAQWPFYTAGDYTSWRLWYKGGEKYDRRRVRREATKARKERARTGQKIAKSKMPGSWNW